MGNEFSEFTEQLNQVLNTKHETNLSDKNNIFVSCKITKQEAEIGCTKKIKFNRITKTGFKENAINIKIPTGIKNNQNIILIGNGNYLKENKYSDLVIKVNIK